MSLQRGGAVETLAAFVALVRFFLSVNDLVPAEGTGEAKTFSAYIADKWPALCMVGHFQVNGQCVFSFKDFSTLVTSMNSLVCAILRPRTTQLICLIQMRAFSIPRR